MTTATKGSFPNLQTATFSAADFLSSISADSSVHYGSPTASKEASASSRPELPISAKVSLIDAQIDNLEKQIQQTIVSHCDELKQRAASARSVDQNLNRLWQSINQTSSRLVTISPSVVPAAVEYRDALQQSKKLELLTSVLANLLSALKELELLEHMLQQGDLKNLGDKLQNRERILHPLTSNSVLRDLPPVLELKRRFDRIAQQHDERTKSSSGAPDREAPGASLQQAATSTSASADQHTNLSPASKVLEKARNLIISRAAEGGWKAVKIRIEVEAKPVALEAHAEPEPPSQSSSSHRVDSPKLPNRLEELVQTSTPMSRNSSDSSSITSRKTRAKLGARVLRPQDQLGSGPFNAEDVPVDETGWDLDDDDDTNSALPPIQSSTSMEPSSSTSSLQRAAFAVQPAETEVEEEDAWGLSEQEKEKRRSMMIFSNPLIKASFRNEDHTDDAWDLEEETEDPPLPNVRKDDVIPAESSVVPSAAKQEEINGWELDDDEVAEAEAKREAPLPSSISEPPLAAAPMKEANVGHELAPTLKEGARSADDEKTSIDPTETPLVTLKSKEEGANVREGSSASGQPMRPSSAAQPAPSDVSASSPKEARSGEDGWAFNEEATEDLPSALPTSVSAQSRNTMIKDAQQTIAAEKEADLGGTSEPAAVNLAPVSSKTDDDDDGWAFEEEPSLESQSSAAISKAPIPQVTEALNPHKSTGSEAKEQSRTLKDDSDDEGWGFGEDSQSPSAPRQPPKAAPSADFARQEECTISQRSVDLVRLAEETMEEGIRLLSLDHGANEEQAELLLSSVNNIFELHRSLMPVAHGEVLRDVPSLAMQFFNDCEYLARELVRLIENQGGKISAIWTAKDVSAASEWKEKGLSKLEQQAALTRALGQRWFEAQMTAQSKILLDTLVEADGFARTFDENRYARCERCIKQVVQILEQLGKAWRPILAPSHFHPALGKLVDLVFQKVLHDVMDLEDIGETESEKIGGLIKTLGGLESVFQDSSIQQQSSAPLFVASWFKTSYLIEILTGSLVDIEFLAFEAHALVDYSRQELTGLIKALFADTPNRSKLLHKIELAPSDALRR